MHKILGLSHIVLTVNSKIIKSFNSTLLSMFYGDGKYFEFNHSTIRREMIRSEINLISKISLFKALNGDLPAIELLYSEGNLKRPDKNFGLIFKTISLPLEFDKKELRFGNNYHIKYIFDEKLHINVAYSTNIIDDDYGCWMIVNDFDQQKTFLINEKSNQIISNEEDIIIFRCRVLNTKFSYFTIVLIRDKDNIIEKYYNDDLGLSTIGWFQKNLDCVIETNDFSSSETFPITIFEKSFDAKFLYNNISISHELLKIK